MAKVSLEENSIQKIFHIVKDKYDHLITYLHAKNERACTLKAHVELEKYKLLQMRYHDPQFNPTKLLALKERFIEHHKELTDDKESAHHLVEELESGIQTRPYA